VNDDRVIDSDRTQLPLLRAAGESDADALASMLSGLTDLDLYFRFQAAIGRPPQTSLLARLLCPSGSAWVATRGDDIVGHAMWAWAGRAVHDMRTAELAVVVSKNEQRRGLGVRMLKVAAADAVAAGATRYLFVVSPVNDLVTSMIRRRWPAAAVERDGALLNYRVPARPVAQHVEEWPGKSILAECGERFHTMARDRSYAWNATAPPDRFGADVAPADPIARVQ
jgi:GNAT superfamily N-acetyltransferase